MLPSGLAGSSPRPIADRDCGFECVRSCLRRACRRTCCAEPADVRERGFARQNYSARAELRETPQKTWAPTAAGARRQGGPSLAPETPPPLRSNSSPCEPPVPVLGLACSPSLDAALRVALHLGLCLRACLPTLSLVRAYLPPPAPHTLLTAVFPTRSLSTTPNRASWLSDQIAPRLGDRMGRLIYGNRKERERQRKMGGMLPSDAEAIAADERRDAALGAVGVDGSPLLENEQEQEQIGWEERDANERLWAKKRARLLRKRWGGPNAPPEHKYSTATHRTSHKKLRHLARLVSKEPIDFAILQMQYSHKRSSKWIKSSLVLAREHARAKGLDVSRLVVDQIWVSKGPHSKGIEFKSKGRAGRMIHRTGKINFVLRYGKTWEERDEARVREAVYNVRRTGSGTWIKYPRIGNRRNYAGWTM